MCEKPERNSREERSQVLANYLRLLPSGGDRFPGTDIPDPGYLDGTNGGIPVWPLVQGTDGNLYGSAGLGGTGNSGTIFRVTRAGALTTLQSIEYSHLSVQATDGKFLRDHTVPGIPPVGYRL